MSDDSRPIEEPASKVRKVSDDVVPRFHLAFPVDDVEKAKKFYSEVIGCELGREDPGVWCDFNFFGHQVVAHRAPKESTGNRASNHVDGHNVPVPHFGCVLEWDVFDAFIERLKKHGVKFEIEPYLRFAGKPGEQRTCFFKDPSGNALEFKTFRDMSTLFAT